LGRRLVNQDGFRDVVGEEGKIKFLYERIFQREPTEVEIKLGLDFIDESPAPDQITDANREKLKEQREERQKPQKGGRAMSMASLGPAQLRPIGSWAKYAHALIQANEAIFIN